ncbi:amelotin isoform X2 [Paroedura picta]
MQRFRAMGNNPQQTQQRSVPAYGLPPAKLVPDQTALINQHLPNEVTPLERPFVNFPVTLPKSPLELGATNWQPIPGFTLPYTQMIPIDINTLTALLGLPSIQTLPIGGGGINTPQQMLPPPPPPQMLPIIITQMGPQGAMASSEEVKSLSQVFTGYIIPGMPGILFPSGQSEAVPDGSDILLPAGQAGSNPGNSAQLPLPEGTADATALAGIQKISPAMNDDLSGTANGLHPTPSGFRQPGYGHGVTEDPFAGPTVFIKLNMEPSELREPPTTAARSEDDKILGGHTLAQSLVRGDSHMPLTTRESKLLREP